MSFEALYEAYGRRVVNLAYRMTHDADTAHDLAQDIWLKVYEKLGSFEGKSDVFTWIYRIAMNHVLNYLKKEKRARWLDLLDRKVGDLVQAEAADPATIQRAQVSRQDRGLEKRERAQAVWQAVQQLEDKYRVPLVLHHYEELSYKEIAAVLELGLTAVEARIHRAKRQLIKILGPLVEQL